MSDAYNNIGPEDAPTMSLPVSGGAPGGPGGGPGNRRWSRGKQAAAALGVAAVVGGGAFAVASAATGSPAATDAASTQVAGSQAGTQASTTSQAAALRDVLTSTGARRLERLRLLGGMYGQYTFQTKTGSRTLAFERGTVTSVSGSDVVIRATNGTTLTWELTGTSVVREHGTKESASTLAQGQTVFAAGPVTSGARDARVIVIRDAGTATPKTSTSATATA
jgi:hypothetical protein